MKYSEIPEGKILAFGRKLIKNEHYRGSDEDPEPRFNRPYYTWVKLSNGECFMTNCISGNFDEKHPSTGSCKKIRERGSCFFFDSNIKRFLNGGEMYNGSIPDVERTNYSNNYADRELGFMTEFSEDEKKDMVEMEVTCQVPEGLTRMYGKTHTEKMYVKIPTEEEANGFEGYSGIVDVRTATLEFDDSQNIRILSGSWHHNRRPTERMSFIPMIKISDDAEFDYDENAHTYMHKESCYTLGDLDEFLKEG